MTALENSGAGGSSDADGADDPRSAGALPAAAGGAPILVEGSTCARIATADRLAVLIDADDYFRALLESFYAAHCSITIVGWDFDARVRLDRTDPGSELRQLLPRLIAQRPSLRVRILVWDIAPLYGPSSALGALLDRDWRRDSRIELRSDGHHPVGAAHHEKIVCVDDTVAFVGGMDLTVCRWDSSRHLAHDPNRISPDGESYPPIHDLQLAVGGEAAAAVARIAYDRWADAGGERLTPAAGGSGGVWPRSIQPLLSETPVGIARTRPRLDHRPEVDEIARLNDAALASARKTVYIETQYFTARRVCDRLVALLQERGAAAPEIVILVWEDATGWIERFAMGSNRERMLRRLAAADRRRRVRVYKLAASDDARVEVGLHAKLMLVDDRFLRIGSSNLNNRSLGLDTECDLAIEAGEEESNIRKALAGVRDRLLAEHLGASSDEVATATAAHGLIGAIERLDARARLIPYRIDPDEGPAEPIPGTAVLDPVEPLDLRWLKRRLSGR